MCGLAGVLFDPEARSGPDAIARATACVRRMVSTIAHRGPNASAVWADAAVAVGHARLSVIDLAETGAQPMHSGHGNTIVYNGECYNFRELRHALKALGWSFRGHSDTEVVLAAYESWGLAGLRRIEGMFAIALWDARQRRLILMRDRLGIKPLFIGDSFGGLAFGSEVKAVLAAGGVDKTLNPQALREYLWYGASQDDRTFYRGVRAVPPGHWIICEPGRRIVGPWWQLEEWLKEAPSSRSYHGAVEIVRRQLARAVERQLIADVPVGIFLSGGIDSSAIAAAAVEVGAKDVMCYTADFGESTQQSEVIKATDVARHLGLPVTVVEVAPQSLVPVIESLAHLHDEPFADAANIPLYLMCEALQGRAKVVLQGDGGDEVFGGYRRYALMRYAALWHRIPRSVASIAAKLGSRGKRLSRVVSALQSADGMDMALLLAAETRDFGPEQVLQSDFRAHLRQSTDPFLTYRQAAVRFAHLDPVQRMLLTDLTVQLPSLYLPKVDRATMAHGIEARVPLLDDSLLAEVVGLPSKWKVGHQRKKRILRDAIRGRIPDRILNAPKMGFGVPIASWLRRELREYTTDRLMDRTSTDVLGLDAGQIHRLLAEHHAGATDHGYLIWRLLQLVLWQVQRTVSVHEH